MSLESKNEQDTKKNKDEIFMPDFAELWKEMYFKTEVAWAEAFKEMLSTQTFVGAINKSLEQNLSNEKVTRQIIDKYMEMSSVPSKKDLARIAELVISLEEKIDQMEYQYSNTMGSMADSLLKMADYQVSLKTEISNLHSKLAQIENQLDTLGKKIIPTYNLDKEPKTTKKKVSSNEEVDKEAKTAKKKTTPAKKKES